MKNNIKKNTYLISVGLGILILIGIICSLLFGTGIFTGIVLSIDTMVEFRTWKEKTTPLDNTVVQNLCAVFELSPYDSVCSLSDAVYGPDFFPIVLETFTPKNGNWATFDEVEEMIGTYKYYCEELIKTGDGIEFFVCWYDFNGDHMFPISIFYYSDGNIMKIVANVTN